MTSMKGLLKGLRYISHIFDNEKEQEMQIGNPTDVKHVAHIGWDGPSANTPSWMDEFKGTSLSSMSSNGEVKDNPSPKSSIRDSTHQGIMEMQKSPGSPLDSPTRRNSRKTKQSRQHHASSASVGSPARDLLRINKPRRHKNSGGLDSPTRESSSRARRLQNSNLGLESPSQDPPSIPKESRRRKTKDSSGGGSNGSSRSKAQASE